MGKWSNYDEDIGSYYWAEDIRLSGAITQDYAPLVICEFEGPDVTPSVIGSLLATSTLATVAINPIVPDDDGIVIDDRVNFPTLTAAGYVK